MESGAYTVAFYDLTPAEICDLIASERSRHDREQRTLAELCWHNAHLTALAVLAPDKFPRHPDSYFAFLRDEQAEWQRSKAQMRRFMENNNAKRRC